MRRYPYKPTLLDRGIRAKHLWTYSNGASLFLFTIIGEEERGELPIIKS